MDVGITVTLSLINLVVSTLAKDAATCGLEECLLAVLSVRNLLSELLWTGTRHVWLLARITSVLVNHHALIREVQHEVIQVLVRVQTDLDAASASADTLHVVLVEGDRDDVTCT